MFYIPERNVDRLMALARQRWTIAAGTVVYLCLRTVYQGTTIPEISQPKPTSRSRRFYFPVEYSDDNNRLDICPRLETCIGN